MNVDISLLDPIKNHERVISASWEASGHPSIVWHYTKLEVLKEIVEGSGGRNLHANPLNRMNDHQEGRWISSNLVSQRTYGFPALRRVDDEDPSVFAACFSKEGDRLSQWRAYADGSRGVAIGLKASELNGAVKKMDGRLLRVDYIARDRKGDAFLSLCFENIEELSKQVYALPDEAAGTKRGYPRHLREQLLMIEPIFKNEAFREEGEFRAVLKDDSPEKFRYVRDDIVPFVPIPLGTSIKHVKLGPLCKARENEVRIYLRERLQGDVDVSRSSATLRA